MSKKMKEVALDSSSYGQFEVAKARFKHQTLVQDYQELQKDADSMKCKLKMMKLRKLTLLAEVRFLRGRYRYLSNNEAEKTPQGRVLIQKQNFGTHGKKTTEEGKRSRNDTKLRKIAPTILVDKKEKTTLGKKNSGRKESKLRKVTPIMDVDKEKKVSIAKEYACRNPTPVHDFKMDRIHGGKEAPLGYKIPVFDLNHKERTCGGNQSTFRNPTPILDLNQRERLSIGKETTPRNPPPYLDLNQMERNFLGRENVAQNRAPVFDLNQISGEEESQDVYEPVRMEKSTKNTIGGGTEEQLNDLNLSACRNLGNVPNRMGKRKISWQDQVALKV